MSEAIRDAHVAESYSRSEDLSFFTCEEVPIKTKRSITISIRFSEDELNQLRARAESEGPKVTSSLIRAAALQGDRPVDLDTFGRGARASTTCTATLRSRVPPGTSDLLPAGLTAEQLGSSAEGAVHWSAVADRPRPEACGRCV